MTKSEELSILDCAIRELGPNSYLGPWMAEVREEVERDVRNDFFPSPTVARAKLECEALVVAAQAKAKALVDAAQIQADALAEREQAWRDRARADFREAFLRARGILEC